MRVREIVVDGTVVGYVIDLGRWRRWK